MVELAAVWSTKCSVVSADTNADCRAFSSMPDSSRAASEVMICNVGPMAKLKVASLCGARVGFFRPKGPLNVILVLLAQREYTAFLQ